MNSNFSQRDYEEEKELLESLPKINLPVITLEKSMDILLAQINVKSWVLVDPEKNVLDKHEGFLFEIKLQKNNYPTIKTVGKVPVLYHPHFTSNWYGKWVWVDYEEYNSEYRLSDYLLKIAHSLKYDEGYIREISSVKKGNKNALDWYLEKKNDTSLFPTDNIELPNSFPTDNTELSNSLKRRDILTNSMVNMPTTSKFKTIKKKFEIKKSEPSYNPESRSQPQFKFLREYPSALCRNSIDKYYYIYIKKTAFETIMHHIGWNSVGETSYNIVEQGGILLGKTFIDHDTNITYGVVEQAIAGKSAKGTSAYLEMTHETWKEMFDKADKLLEQSGSEFQIIGWYHTHPNTLDVFMSGTDQATQSRLFGNDWQFAIVLNPQRRIWRAFYGSHSKECKGYIIENEYQNPEH
jgi:proteasome lid subunit RPN8/RPN11